MTDTENTRPVSVAELLAKNGTIGSPPVGGRRRRRRGNADAVTVAELTGEIPVIRDTDLEPEAAPADSVAPEPEPAPAEPATGPVAHEAPAPVDVPELSAEPESEAPSREADVPAAVPAPPAEPVRAAAPRPQTRSSGPERGYDPRPVRKSNGPLPDHPPRRSDARAEMMSPDPVEDDFADGPDALGLGGASYLKSTGGTLFGGETVADDLARGGDRGAYDGDESFGGTLADAAETKYGDHYEDHLHDAFADIYDDDGEPDGHVDDHHDEHDEHDDDFDDYHDDEEPSRGQTVLRGALVVLQSVLAVVFGAGLFIAFDQLWKWDSIVALVLGVLVILGLVIGVRIVRKTEDIGSTLTAVAVGALVTFGPLALLQAS